MNEHAVEWVEWDPDYLGCAPTCARSHAPIHTAHRFPDRGTDRVVLSYAEAIALAERRATQRGRQSVRRHVGHFLKRGAWVVQDATRITERTTTQ